MQNMSPIARFFLRVFNWFSRRDLRDSIEGDLIEQYMQRLQAAKPAAATRRLVIDVILLCRPGIIRSFRSQSGISNQHSYAMIKNNFAIAWRKLLKDPFFSFLNTLGLTVGATSFLLISLYIVDELTFDRFHRKGSSIYRVVDHHVSVDGKETKIAGAGYQLSEQAKTNIAGIDDVVRISGFGRTNITAVGTNNVFYEDFLLGSPALLTIFDFKLLAGDRSSALLAPHSVIVTEETAMKLFGTQQAIGRAIRTGNDTLPYKVTAVLKNFPVNSSISFNLLFSESSIASAGFLKFTRSDWNSDAFGTYFLLNEKANAKQVTAGLDKLFNKNFNDAKAGRYNFILQPLGNIHFYSADIEGGSAGNISYIYIFAILGVFILFIACINYSNLATARFAGRGKEIAVRKVAGASRKNLTIQFLTEAILVTLIAFVLSVLFVQLLLPAFNRFTQKQLALNFHTDYRVWLGVIISLSGVAVIAGIYPALFQSGLKPLALLRNKIKQGSGPVSLRRSLVVFQFSLSIIMIIATMIVYMQMNYLNQRDLGFTKNNLVVVDINSGKVRKAAQLIKDELSKLPQVMNVSTTSRVPGEWKNLPRVKVNTTGGPASGLNEIYFLGADDNFLKTYQVSLVEGRNFYKGTADSASFIINETAAKLLGIKALAAQELVIPSVNYGGDYSPLDKPFEGSIVGIVKDFNFQSLHMPLAPMILASSINPLQAIDYFTIRIRSQNIPATLKQVNAILQSVDKDHLFEYNFMDKQWDRFYREDRIRQTIFTVVSLLAIFIACLGLLGLATYSAEQRVKEIGIRKVLGARVSSIVVLLSKDFVKLILIASLLSFPVAWYCMHLWLNDFAYKISIAWWIFPLAALLAIVIALATISVRAIMAAVANPAKSLRTE